MAEVVWTRWAADELNDIPEFIALDSPQAAKKLVRAAWELTLRLPAHPRIGKPLKELPGFSYRELILTPLPRFHFTVPTTEGLCGGDSFMAIIYG